MNIVVTTEVSNDRLITKQYFEQQCNTFTHSTPFCRSLSLTSNTYPLVVSRLLVFVVILQTIYITFALGCILIHDSLGEHTLVGKARRQNTNS